MKINKNPEHQTEKMLGGLPLPSLGTWFLKLKFKPSKVEVENLEMNILFSLFVQNPSEATGSFTELLQISQQVIQYL